MNKAQLLAELSEALRSGEITRAEVNQILGVSGRSQIDVPESSSVERGKL